MKIIRKRLRKCWTPSQTGNPAFSAGWAGSTVPGFRTMKSWTAGMDRSPLAAATATIRARNPIGSIHSRLNQRRRPMRTRGAIPVAWGTEPAQVAGSTTSPPTVNCERNRRTASGDGLGDGSCSPPGSSMSLAPMTYEPDTVGVQVSVHGIEPSLIFGTSLPNATIRRPA